MTVSTSVLTFSIAGSRLLITTKHPVGDSRYEQPDLVSCEGSVMLLQVLVRGLCGRHAECKSCSAAVLQCHTGGVTGGGGGLTRT